MPTYEVTVPISSLSYDEHPSWLAILPETYELNQLRFKRPVGSVNAQTVYLCIGTVSAPDSTVAIVEVLRRANEVLWAMATWNGSYRADTSGTIAREVAGEPEAPTSSPVTRTRAVRIRTVIAEQRDTQLEANAFAWRASWPSWMTTALELNYLAVATRDVRPALVIHWSILEVLADEHDPGTQLLSGLDPAARRELLRKIQEVAASFLNASSIERLLARLNDTQAESTVNRIHSTLQRYGIDASLSDINAVRKQRGMLAHGAATGGDYLEAEGQARIWVQAVLRSALTDRGQPTSRQ